MRARNSYKENLVKEKTIELLVLHGFEGFTVNKLAKACEISIATLYIYYKDKDDLIIQIGREEINKMREAIIQGVNLADRFENGLRIQWKNRYDYLMSNRLSSSFLEMVRTSSYQDQIYTGFKDEQDDISGKFMRTMVARGEIPAIPAEVYWSIAFSPLLTLIRAHQEGARPGGKSFILTDETLWQTFDLVIKALVI